jgi:hypothetical protein
VATYRSTPAGEHELALADLPVEFDLADEHVDYDDLYGADAGRCRPPGAATSGSPTFPATSGGRCSFSPATRSGACCIP